MLKVRNVSVFFYSIIASNIPRHNTFFAFFFLSGVHSIHRPTNYRGRIEVFPHSKERGINYSKLQAAYIPPPERIEQTFFAESFLLPLLCSSLPFLSSSSSSSSSDGVVSFPCTNISMIKVQLTTLIILGSIDGLYPSFRSQGRYIIIDRFQTRCPKPSVIDKNFTCRSLSLFLFVVCTCVCVSLVSFRGVFSECTHFSDGAIRTDYADILSFHSNSMNYLRSLSIIHSHRFPIGLW